MDNCRPKRTASDVSKLRPSVSAEPVRIQSIVRLSIPIFNQSRRAGFFVTLNDSRTLTDRLYDGSGGCTRRRTRNKHCVLFDYSIGTRTLAPTLCGDRTGQGVIDLGDGDRRNE